MSFSNRTNFIDERVNLNDIFEKMKAEPIYRNAKQACLQKLKIGTDEKLKELIKRALKASSKSGTLLEYSSKMVLVSKDKQR